MTTEATTRKTGKNGRRRSAVLLSLAVGTALAASVAMTTTTPGAQAAITEKVVFASNRTTALASTTPPAISRSSG